MKRPRGRGPSLFRPGNGRIWHFRFTRSDGVRIQRSTGTWSRLHAQAIADQEYRDDQKIPTVAELVAMWVEAHERVVSASHLRSIEAIGKRHLYGLADLRIDQVGTADVEEARNLYLTGHAQTSGNAWLARLRLLFSWAQKRELIFRVPWSVRRIRTQKKVRALLPLKKTHTWLNAVDAAAGKRWALAAAIRLMVGIGLRESEALSARWEWLDFEQGTYTPGRTKGREADPVSVPSWLLDFLKRRRRDMGPIACSPRGGEYSKGATRSLILAANEEAGTPGVTAHRLRGNFATRLSTEGVPIQEIQRAMRHKDPVTTFKYLEVDMDRVRAAQEAIAEKSGLNMYHGIGRKTGEPEPREPHE